ncbi:unnamed protein product, partial [Durusdinium trenchii]
ELVDCVQCQRCRLHAKLFSLGLGTALKILLSPEDLISSTTSRNDVVALVNVLWKMSDSLEDVRLMTRDYYGQHRTVPQDRQSGTGAAVPQRIEGDNQPMPLSARRELLDLSFTAVRHSSSKGQLPSEAEEKLLRFLVSGANEEVLLLARHYALERPEIFCRMALFSSEHLQLVTAPNAAPVEAYGTLTRPADAIILGGGLAGMSAAMALLDRRGAVVMVEKQPYLGGNSGKASSGINAALETSVESLVADTTKSAGTLARPELIKRLAEDSAEAVAWLRDRTSVDLSLRSQLGGHSVKRTLRPSNAFVGAEITFAAGQVLTKIAEQSDRFRLLLKSKWTGLTRPKDLWQVEIEVNGSSKTLYGHHVVIATGGFGHDIKEMESLLLKYRPDLADFPTTLGSQTTGDGVKLARDLGARLVDMDRVQLHPTGFVDMKKPTENTKTLCAELLRGVGGLLLDRHGNRFTNELGTRQAVVNAELKADEAGLSLPAPSPHRAFALVLNSKAAKVADRHVTLYSKKGLLTKVEGIEGLAQHFGYEVDTLRRSLQNYNEAAKNGSDVFGRTVFPEYVIEETEDFYVGEVVPVIHYTMGGIAINIEGQVLDDQEKVISGLYSVGEASGGVHGDNRLAGNSLLECTVFGRHVGMSLPIRWELNIVGLWDPALTEIASATDFAVTSTERGIPRYEHPHLVAALDVLLEYQRNRKTTYFKIMGHRAQTSMAPYRHDPRTRLIELLKRWLRSNAANSNLSEEEVRRMCGLCRDLLNYPNLFPSRNKTSFMHALSEAYEHLELQLRQVLERDRTCAELAQRCLSLSRNLVADAIAYLLLAATHLTQTDQLPSLEVVVLWQSLPAVGNPLPSRADPQLQKSMQDAWPCLIGSLITALLGLRWTFHLFAGGGSEEELKGLSPLQGSPLSITSQEPAENALAQIRRVRDEFAAGHFKYSGLAGPFRDPQQQESREHLLTAVESLYDLLYLLGEVLLHFHRISDSLGDYGMIRVSTWLHPCLDSVIEKVQRLQGALKGLSKAVDAELVIAKARGRTVKKPLPSERMSARAHAAIERALAGQDCHLTALLHSLEELKARSAPERLPHVVEGLGDACLQLQNVLTSPQFRARVGDSFPHHLPSLANITSRETRASPLALTDEPLGDFSDPEDEAEQRHEATGRGRALPEPDANSPPGQQPCHTACFFAFPDTKRRSSSLSALVRATSHALRAVRGSRHSSLPAPLSPPMTPKPTESVAECVAGAGRTATSPPVPAELVSELPAAGWISHVGKGGRVSWHHKSLGPAPWERQPETDELDLARAPDDQLPDTNPFSDAFEEAPAASRSAPVLPRQGYGTPSTSASPHGRFLAQPCLETRTSSTPHGCSDGAGTPARADLREVRAATVPDFLHKGCLRAEVERLTTGVQGWKTHDSRSLLITGSQLLIYEKGSMDQVKTVVNLLEDVERCSLLSSGILSLEVKRRRKRASSLSRATSRALGRAEKEDAEKKLYFFKFEPQELANQFSDIISSMSPELSSASAGDVKPQIIAASERTPSITSLPKITQQELEKHRAEGDLWVALHGHIYDMSEYVWEHPGGSSAIFDVGGLDGTETFEAVHNKELLETMGFQPVAVLA